MLKRLQQWHPRDLALLHVEPDGGRLAQLVHAGLADSRLRGDWHALGESAADRVRQVIAAVDDREHSHTGPPSYSAYSQGCRHPACADERAAYSRELLDRRKRGDWTDLRKLNRPPRQEAAEAGVAEVPDRVLEPEPDLGPAVAVVAAAVEVDSVQVVQDEGAPASSENAEPLSAEIEVDHLAEEPNELTNPVQPEPEIAPDDEGLVLGYLRRFTLPDGRVYSAMADVNVLATATTLDPDRVAVAVRKLLKSGALVKRGEDLFLGEPR